MSTLGSREMVQRLRALATLTEDTHSVARTDTTMRNLVLRDPMPTVTGTACMWYTYTNQQNTHTYKINTYNGKINDVYLISSLWMNWGHSVTYQNVCKHLKYA